MPELIVVEKKPVKIEAPYGDSKMHVQIRSSIPWYSMLPVFETVKDVDKFTDWPTERQMALASKFLLIAAGGCDLTQDGQPVAFTEDVYDGLPELTKMNLLVEFMPHMVRLLGDFSRSAEAARKSRKGNLPVLNHGHGRAAGRKSKKRRAA